MKILIIGGNGFVGEYLTKELLFAGLDEVRVISRSKPEIVLEGVQYEQLDIADLTVSTDKLIKDTEVLVWAVQPNLESLKKVLGSATKSNSLKKIVYLSTVLLYPDSELGQNEETAPAPKTDYEKQKFEEERELQAFVADSNIVLAIARLGNVYGDTKNKGIINYMMLALIKHQPLKINGSGSQVRDYVLVDDVAKCLALLIHSPQQKKVEIVNISKGSGTSINEIIKLVEETSGQKLETENSDPVEEKQSVVADNQKLMGMIGKYCFTGLDLGLHKTYQKYLKNYQN